jgi:hypothetical protein
MSRAVLMILANAEPAGEAEFNRWYDREHMRERVEIPGFLSAQRYAAIGEARWKYLATYEAEGLATFRSDPYRQALANQTAWSRSMLSTFRDPQRAVAERTCRAGYGIARTVSLVRLRPVAGGADALRRSLAEALARVVTEDGVIEASLLESDPSLSGPVAEYPKGGLDVVRRDDWFVSVGAGNRAVDVTKLVPSDQVAALESLGSFALLWDLHRSDLDALSSNGI